jgi:hypothetical protein
LTDPGGETLQPTSQPAMLRGLRPLGVVLVNLIPIIGVLMLGWPAGVLLILYWCENVVIGGVNVLRMLATGLALGLAGLALCLFVVPFFVVHYGMFTFVHGMFVVMLGSVGGEGPTQSPDTIPGLFGIVRGLIEREPGFAWSLAAIVAWQLWAFVFDWLLRGEARRSNPMAQMFQPYPRIIVLHVTLILGLGLVMSLGQPVWAIVVLAVIKTAFDLFALRGRTGFEMSPAQQAATSQAIDRLNGWLRRGDQTRR